MRIFRIFELFVVAHRSFHVSCNNYILYLIMLIAFFVYLVYASKEILVVFFVLSVLVSLFVEKLAAPQKIVVRIAPKCELFYKTHGGSGL